MYMHAWLCLYFFSSDSPEKTRHLFSEIALNSLLQLLKKEVAENSRHLNQYFQVFLNYANRGVAEVRAVVTTVHYMINVLIDCRA